MDILSILCNRVNWETHADYLKFFMCMLSAQCHADGGETQLHTSGHKLAAGASVRWRRRTIRSRSCKGMLPCLVKDPQLHYFMLHICWLPWQPRFLGNSQVRWLLSAPKKKKKREGGVSVEWSLHKNPTNKKRFWLSLVVVEMVTEVFSIAAHSGFKETSCYYYRWAGVHFSWTCSALSGEAR